MCMQIRLSQKCGPEVYWWSLEVLMYEMVGKFPYKVCIPPKQCTFCLTRNVVSILRRASKVNIKTKQLEVPYYLIK